MKTINNIKIIGVDAGYGNMKTANFCFRTGLTAYDTEPLFTKNKAQITSLRKENQDSKEIEQQSVKIQDALDRAFEAEQPQM